MISHFKVPTFESIQNDLFSQKQVKVFVLRDDLIHPFISGNKWRKLRYNIEEFQKLKKSYLLTFGGAYSNHIVATAAAGKEFGIKTVGIIRGEELNSESNPALQFAERCGMKLIFITRTDFRKKEDPDFISSLIKSNLNLKMEDVYVLSEGGMGDLAMKGCAEIVEDVPVEFDYICCACGTGTTLAGIASSLKENQKAIGISVLNDEGFLEQNISSWTSATNFQVIHDYDFGGYHKLTKELDDFCRSFYSKHKIEIEPTYTGKLFYALYDLISKDYFKAGTSIVAIHTGGIFDWTKTTKV